MKLRDYMKTNKLSDEQFAEMVGGGTTPRAVRKWKYGETRPRLEDIPRVEAATDGAVCLSDFIAPLSPQQTIEGDAA